MAKAEEHWETYPVTPDRFEDFADVINKNRRPTLAQDRPPLRDHPAGRLSPGSTGWASTAGAPRDPAYATAPSMSAWVTPRLR
jgi:hypothetical protein